MREELKEELNGDLISNTEEAVNFLFEEYGKRKKNIVDENTLKMVFEEIVNFLYKNLSESDRSAIANKKLQKVLDQLTHKNQIEAYYKKIKTDFEEEKDDDNVLGPKSDKDAYIDAYTTINGEEVLILDCIEEWASKIKYGVMLLHGQPGDGKTTLCKKAIYDFKVGDRFCGFDAVFYFSLNKSRIIETNGDFDKQILIQRAFHAENGDIRLFEKEDCQTRKTIIFLDGFDEIRTSLDNAFGNGFHALFDTLFEDAKYNSIHFVVTSRTNAVKEAYYYNNRGFKAFCFSPLSFETQENWIVKQKDEGLIQHWKTNIEAICRSQKKSDIDKELNALLKTPFIFRMVIQQRYVPNSNIVSKAQLFESLFEWVINNYKVSKYGPKTNIYKSYKKTYEELAKNIWLNNDDTTVVLSEEKDPLLFNYYLKENEHGIGFMHRSIYQYFLASYFFKEFILLNSTETSQNYLIMLSNRYIDRDVIKLFSEILELEENKKILEKIGDEPVNLLIDTIDKTQCILETLKMNLKGKSEFKNPTVDKERYTRANNIFKNSVNILCNFTIEDSIYHKDGFYSLFTKFSSSNLNFNYPKSKILFPRGDLSFADFSRANLNHMKMLGMSLEGANFELAELNDVDFTLADLNRANLKDAKLKEAVLYGADLRGANLSGADLREADLRKANLSGADLCGADLRGAIFEDTKLAGANLMLADYLIQDLKKANYTGVILNNNGLIHRDIEGLDLDKIVIL